MLILMDNHGAKPRNETACAASANRQVHFHDRWIRWPVPSKCPWTPSRQIRGKGNSGGSLRDRPRCSIQSVAPWLGCSVQSVVPRQNHFHGCVEKVWRRRLAPADQTLNGRLEVRGFSGLKEFILAKALYAWQFRCGSAGLGQLLHFTSVLG